jgi:hypothetical protein
MCFFLGAVWALGWEASGINPYGYLCNPGSLRGVLMRNMLFCVHALRTM